MLGKQNEKESESEKRREIHEREGVEENNPKNSG
jgi:hypothetical protein